jgi:hypothetical protein
VEQVTDTECALIQQNGYVSANGARYTVFCSYDPRGYDLYVTYTSDFISCINGCSQWNIDNPGLLCMGAVWDSAAYGPDGRQCFYKWNLTGTGRLIQFRSAAILETSGKSSTVLTHFGITKMRPIL